MAENKNIKSFSFNETETKILARYNNARVMARDWMNGMNDVINNFIVRDVVPRLNISQNKMKTFTVDFDSNQLTIEFFSDEEIKKIEEQINERAKQN